MKLRPWCLGLTDWPADWGCRLPAASCQLPGAAVDGPCCRCSTADCASLFAWLFACLFAPGYQGACLLYLGYYTSPRILLYGASPPHTARFTSPIQTSRYPPIAGVVRPNNLHQTLRPPPAQNKNSVPHTSCAVKLGCRYKPALSAAKYWVARQRNNGREGHNTCCFGPLSALQVI